MICKGSMVFLFAVPFTVLCVNLLEERQAIFSAKNNLPVCWHTVKSNLENKKTNKKKIPFRINI